MEESVGRAVTLVANLVCMKFRHIDFKLLITDFYYADKHKPILNKSFGKFVHF